MAHFLVIGGAGYIGSHTVLELQRQKHHVTVLDNLITGHRQALTDCDFIRGDLGDATLLNRIFSEQAIDCVMHFAAFSLVGESVSDPLKYYDNNTGATICLLRAMQQHGVNRFILSSTAAVYGEPKEIPIPETAATAPTNPYGRSKRFVEKILHDMEAACGVRYVSLRYFNAAGADGSGCIGEDHAPETHLIPLVLQVALGKRAAIDVYGTDWNTPDGTCLRDYVHVTDLASAHILAAQHLLNGGTSRIYNLGCQQGVSVKEVIRLARKVTGCDIPVHEAPRRSGDPERLVAASNAIRSDLGWVPAFEDPEVIISTAWRWHRKHPQGYRNRKRTTQHAEKLTDLNQTGAF
ncbi:MAG: UDP-glucose 4-epimerase GalE [Desulfobacterales bacterium]|nr:UDP-glucose 4-epimerase GalE [Desulfobacterales bacterium]